MVQEVTGHPAPMFQRVDQAVAAVTAFTPLMGGVPILVGKEVVGAVGVSGAANAQQDDEIAVAGAAALQNTPATKG